MSHQVAKMWMLSGKNDDVAFFLTIEEWGKPNAINLPFGEGFFPPICDAIGDGLLHWVYQLYAKIWGLNC